MAKDKKITITEEDLKNNPDLAKQGVKVGDDVNIPHEAQLVSREEFDALKAKHADLQKQLAKLVSAGEAPKEEPKPEIPKKTFKVGGGEYKFRFAQFIVPGIGKRTAEEAMTDKDLLKKLVETNSGLIKEVF